MLIVALNRIPTPPSPTRTYVALVVERDHPGDVGTARTARLDISTATAISNRSSCGVAAVVTRPRGRLIGCSVRPPTGWRIWDALLDRLRSSLANQVARLRTGRNLHRRQARHALWCSQDLSMVRTGQPRRHRGVGSRRGPCVQEPHPRGGARPPRWRGRRPVSAVLPKRSSNPGQRPGRWRRQC